jgi:hypothetical protein
MKRMSRIILVAFTMCIMLTGNVAFAESELQSETLAANSPAAVLAAAGITQAEITQLRSLQGIIANLISSGQVTARQAKDIVQQHINNPPKLVQTTQNSTIPFQALRSKYPIEAEYPSVMQPMAVSLYGGSHYEALTYYNNPYASGHGFQQASGNILLPSGITVAYSNNQQNDFPYMSLGMFHATTGGGAGCEAGIVYESNGSGGGSWYPFIYSFATGYTSQYMVDTGIPINKTSTPAIYMAVLLDESTGLIRQVVYGLNGAGILADNVYSVRNMNSYIIGAPSYQMFRTTGVMRKVDSASITGTYVDNIQWSDVQAGSFNNTGDSVGSGTWNTVRGLDDFIDDGNVPGAVSVFNKTLYSQETVVFSY